MHCFQIVNESQNWERSLDFLEDINVSFRPFKPLNQTWMTAFTTLSHTSIHTDLKSEYDNPWGRNLPVQAIIMSPPTPPPPPEWRTLKGRFDLKEELVFEHVLMEGQE